MARKIIQLVTGAETNPEKGVDHTLYALCDDGTVWYLCAGEMFSTWDLIEPIPQDAIEDMEVD